MQVETLTINKKKYVVVEQKEFDKLQKRAVLGDNSDTKLFSLEEAKNYAHNLIDNWHKEKLKSSKK
jgi:hypothetical protein